MSDFDAIRRRYANSLWLRSELTIWEGPLRNSFDPEDVQAAAPQEYRITLTTRGGRQHDVIVSGGAVDLVHWEGGQFLLVFPAYLGDSLMDFAVVTPAVERRRCAVDERRRIESAEALRMLP